MNYEEIIKKSKCIVISALDNNPEIYIDFAEWSKYTNK